jgi:two-component system, LytTR family, sensor kinase
MADVVSELETRVSGRETAELPKKADESPIGSATSPAAGHARHGRELKRAAIAAIVLFWTGQFLFFSLDRLLRSPGMEEWPNFAARLIVTAIGGLLSLAVLRILQRQAGTSFVRRTIVALALAIGAAAVHSVINILVFNALTGPPEGDRLTLQLTAAILPSLVYLFSWVYLAITVILLSLTYGEELISRERRIAELSSAADRARLSALRYQLNPHFLFNALNSAASLVSGGRNADAEAMLENLADFLRASLRLDAGKEIRLSEELALQSLYLNVEQVRFPHRLRVKTHVPDDLLDAIVPNLITQPLLENSIKHTVAQSTGPVDVAIAARQADEKLIIEVSDHGDADVRSTSSGTGVGLQNVANRLRLHFGDEAALDAGPVAGGGFNARITMPLRRRS